MYSVVSWSISLLSCVNQYCWCIIEWLMCSSDGVYGGVFVCFVFTMMSAILSTQWLECAMAWHGLGIFFFPVAVCFPCVFN